MKKNTWCDWYDWFINYISKAEKKVGDVKNKSILKRNTAKDYSKPTCVKNVYGGGKKARKLKLQKRSEDNNIKYIRNLCRLKKKMKQSKTA